MSIPIQIDEVLLISYEDLYMKSSYSEFSPFSHNCESLAYFIRTLYKIPHRNDFTHPQLCYGSQ